MAWHLSTSATDYEYILNEWTYEQALLAHCMTRRTDPPRYEAP